MTQTVTIPAYHQLHWPNGQPASSWLIVKKGEKPTPEQIRDWLCVYHPEQTVEVETIPCIVEKRGDFAIKVEEVKLVVAPSSVLVGSRLSWRQRLTGRA